MRKRFHLILLVGSALALGVLTLQYVALDGTIGPPTDSEYHLFTSQSYARHLRLAGPSDLLQVVRTTNVIWPPLTYVLYGALCLLTRFQALFFLAGPILVVALQAPGASDGTAAATGGADPRRRVDRARRGQPVGVPSAGDDPRARRGARRSGVHAVPG